MPSELRTRQWSAGLRSGKRSRPPHVSWTSPGACLTHNRPLRARSPRAFCALTVGPGFGLAATPVRTRRTHSSIFSRSFRLHSLDYACATIAKSYSLWLAFATAIMSQTRSREAIVLGRQDCAGRVEPLSSWSSAGVRGSAVRLSSLKVSRRTAPPEAGIKVHIENDAPFATIRNLRCRGASPARPPAVYLPAPQYIEGAHEKNARECNSRGRVARRSG